MSWKVGTVARMIFWLAADSLHLFDFNQLVTVVSLSVLDQHSISSGSELDQHLISTWSPFSHVHIMNNLTSTGSVSQPDFVQLVQLAISLLKSPRVIWSEEHHYHWLSGFYSVQCTRDHNLNDHHYYPHSDHHDDRDCPPCHPQRRPLPSWARSPAPSATPPRRTSWRQGLHGDSNDDKRSWSW